MMHFENQCKPFFSPHFLVSFIKLYVSDVDFVGFKLWLLIHQLTRREETCNVVKTHAMTLSGSCLHVTFDLCPFDPTRGPERAKNNVFRHDRMFFEHHIFLSSGFHILTFNSVKKKLKKEKLCLS